MVAPKNILFESWHFVKYIGKMTSVRMRFTAGDPALVRPKDLTQLHSQREFDKMYIALDPFFIYKIRRVEIRRMRAAVKRGKANSQ